ncbi:hypothetical protein FGO68_gene11204 [Halteria grandinella]|uniref:Uncharacterized protein n=1 Tax=Halteria grandinella TaxID=5974 RepID=A0A8J8T4X4_HALGN|nr:hypothetical protein FGO68_gene11204 [Halteria grandinella]
MQLLSSAYQPNNWLSVRSPHYPVTITLTLRVPSYVELISVAFSGLSRVPESYSIYMRYALGQGDKQQKVDIEGEMLRQGRIMCMNDRRIGTFVNCEEIPHRVKTLLKEEEKISQIQLVIHEPNEGDPFAQVALSLFCLYVKKPHYKEHLHLPQLLTKVKQTPDKIDEQSQRKVREEHLKKKNLMPSFNLYDYQGQDDVPTSKSRNKASSQRIGQTQIIQPS